MFSFFSPRFFPRSVVPPFALPAFIHFFLFYPFFRCKRSTRVQECVCVCVFIERDALPDFEFFDTLRVIHLRAVRPSLPLSLRFSALVVPCCVYICTFII